jgi:hypothetical protein
MVLTWCHVGILGLIRLNRLVSSLISTCSASVSLLISELLVWVGGVSDLAGWCPRFFSRLGSAFGFFGCSSERPAKPGATRISVVGSRLFSS